MHSGDMLPFELDLMLDPPAGASPVDTPEKPISPPSNIEVRRSARRRRTVSAYREGERTIVLLPARMSRSEEARWVAEMVARLDAQDRRTRPTDDELMTRAERLSGRYLDGRAVPSSVRWVGNQRTRWGSCTIDDRTIRLSDRMLGMPEWVVDYVLLHELAHLIEPGHDQRFWTLLESYDGTERARGFLDGWSAARQAAGLTD
jgi:predicted metal-dependent hydrolase